MLTGLRTWWLSAISTPFLHLYVTPRSLVVGFIAGIAVSLVAMLWTLRRSGRVSVHRLLARQSAEDLLPTHGKSAAARGSCSRCWRWRW